MLGVLFARTGRERVGAPAERLAADAQRPLGGVSAVGGVWPPRNVPLERRLTLNAAVRAGVRWVVLTHFAEQRAKPGPVVEPPGRDLALEALEELADARNYLVWRAVSELRRPAPDGDVGVLVQDALTHLAAAFDVVVRLHDRRPSRVA